MSELRTDFKDDVLDVTQNEKRKYRVIHNDDGTISLEDATVYLQQGDSFGANDLNEMNRMANQMNEAAGEILTMADDIDTLQEDVEALESNLSNLGADEVPVDDTNLALGGTTVQDILELINTKLDTEVVKLYDRWWWKSYDKTVTGTTVLDISSLEFQEIEIISTITENNKTYIASKIFTINDIPSASTSCTITGGSTYPYNRTTMNVSRNTVKITDARVYSSAGASSNYTTNVKLSVKYR